MLTNLTPVNILQSIHISNHCGVHLQLTQCYTSIVSQKSSKTGHSQSLKPPSYKHRGTRDWIKGTTNPRKEIFFLKQL